MYRKYINYFHSPLLSSFTLPLPLVHPHLTPIRMAIFKYITINVGEDVGKKESLYIVSGNVN
jgi:hypothetical protein